MYICVIFFISFRWIICIVPNQYLFIDIHLLLFAINIHKAYSTRTVRKKKEIERERAKYGTHIKKRRLSANKSNKKKQAIINTLTQIVEIHMSWFIEHDKFTF